LVDAVHRESEIAAVAVGRSSTCAARAGTTKGIIRRVVCRIRIMDFPVSKISLQIFQIRIMDFPVPKISLQIFQIRAYGPVQYI